MDAPRRTVFQTTKPNDGYSEWSSKIKELQRLVDADEEKEQRKLEDEIAASRLARLRRSRGVGSRTNSIDAANDPELKDKLTKLDNSLAAKEEGEPSADKRQQQDSPLSKFSGLPSASSLSDMAKPIYSHPAAIAKRTEPMSLAAFMGGSATGPRLRKHAPQQDATDHTQFEQRTSITAPHPVFGTGGIALPGMLTKSKTLPTSDPISTPASSLPASVDLSPNLNAISVPLRNATRSVSPVPSEQGLARRSTSPPKVATSHSTSQIPTKVNFVGLDETDASSTTQSQTSWRGSITKTSSIPISLAHPASLMRTSPSPKPASSLPAPSQVSSSPNKLPTGHSQVKPRENAPPIFLPRQHTSSTPSASPIQVPYLAGPIKPEPRLPSQSPKIPPSQNPSRAFLKTTPPKDPTPSLSRLKGRGFVRSMIKASSELEVASMPALKSLPPGDRPSSTGKKVLDRWQPVPPTSITPPPPTIAPKPITPRRSTGSTEELLNKPIAQKQKRKSLPAPDSRPEGAQSLETKMPPEGTPGLGSGSTLISYMKVPERTSPSPRAVSPSRIPSPCSLPSGILQPSKAPDRLATREPITSGLLSHPTKFRAKRAKKIPTNSVFLERDAIKLPPTHTIQPVAPQQEYSQAEISRRTPVTGKVGQLTGQQLQQPIFGAKVYTSSVTSAPSPDSVPTSMKGHPAYRALPGLTESKEMSHKAAGPEPQEHQPKTSKPSTNIGVQEDVPQSPNRHTRIPSTGNRPTIMDVAQILNENANKVLDQPASKTFPPAPVLHESSMEPAPETETELALATARPQNIVPSQTEKRKSSYEKYSSFMMPPLLEEKTPAASPAGTLSRSVGDLSRSTPIELLETASTVLEDKPVAEAKSPEDKLIHFDIRADPLPTVDIAALLNTKNTSFAFNSSDTEVISLEVLAVASHIATPIKEDHDIFYDSEVLAVIQRAKSRSTGLVKTTVWGWRGQQGKLGDQEAQKLREISKRYGTSLLLVEQSEERVDLIHALGGKLAVRNGQRSLWSADNTSMHIVQKVGEVVIIEERELSKANLCSGFSFCISFLNTVYVWHGRGSLTTERQASFEYGNRIAGTSTPVVFSEGEEQPLFWMMFGDEEYARADYWRFRPTTDARPRAWRIDAQSGKNAAYPLPIFSEDTYSQSGIFLLDCVWEFYVLVGEDARDMRQDIRLAIQIGQQMCCRLSQSRPYTPNLHVLVLPSRIPVDLPMHFKQFNEVFLQTDTVHGHINVLSSQEADEHLGTTSWMRSALQDRAMLPLGLSPNQVDSALITS